MSFIPNLPPSVLAKNEEAEAIGGKRTKEDYRKMKELEEARKLATVPAMQDEHGKDINPHIPQYIMQAPWYYHSLQPTLRHQNRQPGQEPKKPSIDTWYRRGAPQQQQQQQQQQQHATKYRKGACANCGAMTHKAKDCLERPRQRGAKWTGEDIAPDEQQQPELQLDYDGKRDRWNGYDPGRYKQVIDNYTKLEEARKIVRSKQLAAAGHEEADEDRYAEEMAMPGQKFDSKERQSVRNLRIREDTAKYLYNLDPNSAYYDPKTRAMRGNPFEGKEVPKDESPFAGDNYVRYQGDALPMMQQQMFAWELHSERGVDAHLQADPTRLELLRRQLGEKEKEISGQVAKDILEKYGGQEHLLSAGQDELTAVAQNEQYAEYSRSGAVLRGDEAPVVRSRYEEDVHPLNHTSAWGSYWRDGRWGYACCHQLLRAAYCTGEKGKQAAHVAAVAAKRPAPGDKKAAGGKVKRKKAKSSSGSSSSSDSSSSGSSSSSDEEAE